MNLSKLATFIVCLTISATAFATSGRKDPPVTTDTGTNSVRSAGTTEPIDSNEASFWERFYKALMG
ncbi:hypothetical protein SG34_018410 [Thalassomonas viridans]|uniref:Uncharacterized protein n=1 Tax=Thalassomonas viridans TaxID=137584 RepID=A0AAE9YZQ0_9GAMM|nr:hypothetical protein [Thalassomonas viridans]WDE03364.1 hypothetical protein SG34_018410 [Thalassomonas viridans]